MAKKTSFKKMMASATALAVSGVMLIGTTYAWFTSGVTTSNNEIATGNLHIGVEYSKDMEKWETLKSDTNVFEKDAKWEPGRTEVVYLRMTNEGSLALKYSLGINIVDKTIGKTAEDKDIDLANYIKYGVDDTVTEAYGTGAAGRKAAREAVKNSATWLATDYLKESKLVKEEESETVALVVYMPEEIGNEANYGVGKKQPKINLGLTVMAGQLPEESDAFGDDYDENAEWFRISNTFDKQEDVEAMFASHPDVPNSNIKVQNGVGVIEKEGAWFSLPVHLDNYIYTVEFDVAVSEGSVKFDAGYTAIWQSRVIELKEDAHVTYTFYKADGKTGLANSIQYVNGGATVKYSVLDSRSATQLYWDIYNLNGKATIDNFTVIAEKAPDFYTTSPEGLKDAIASAKAGDVIGLAGDIDVGKTTTYVPSGVTIDGYGNVIKSTKHTDGSAVFMLSDVSDVTIKNITIGGEDFAGVLIYGDAAENIMVENVTFNDNAGVYIEAGVKNITVKNCTFNGTSALQVDDDTSKPMTGIRLENNVFKGESTWLAFYFCEINWTEFYSRLIVKGNTFDLAFDKAVRLNADGYVYPESDEKLSDAQKEAAKAHAERAKAARDARDAFDATELKANNKFAD